VVVLVLAPVVPERPRAPGDRRIVAEHRPRITVGPEVLCGVEAGRGGCARGPGSDPVLFRPVRLGGVLEHEDPARRGEGPEGAHRRHLPVEVHGEDRLRAPADPLGNARGVYQMIHGVAVDEDGCGARAYDRERGGDEAVGGDDDLVAGTDSRGAERDLEGVGPAAHAHAVRGTGEASKGLLEGTHIRAQHEGRLGEHAGQPLTHLLGDLAVLRAEIDQGDRVRHTASSRAALTIER